MYEIVLKCALSDFVQVNHPAASSGAWKLKRPKGRGIDPRGIRQIPMQAWLFSSLLAGIKYLRAGGPRDAIYENLQLILLLCDSKA